MTGSRVRVLGGVERVKPGHGVPVSCGAVILKEVQLDGRHLGRPGRVLAFAVLLSGAWRGELRMRWWSFRGKQRGLGETERSSRQTILPVGVWRTRYEERWAKAAFRLGTFRQVEPDV